jgi:hypothetical protein
VINKNYLLPVVLVILFGCNQEKKSGNPLLEFEYFKPGSLSEDRYFDSINSVSFSKLLHKTNEPSFTTYSGNDILIRLIIKSSYLPNYIIRINQIDTTLEVSYKVIGGSYQESLGVDNLNMIYTGKTAVLDSIRITLNEYLDEVNFYTWDNSAFVDGADGAIYVLEVVKDGQYFSVLRWDVGFLRPDIYKPYKDGAEFIHIIDLIRSFVPHGLLPKINKSLQIESLIDTR